MPPDPQKARAAKAEIFRAHDDLMKKNHYQLFGVAPDAAPDFIRAAYLKLAKKWHSDAYSGIDLGEAKAMLDAIFKRITEAYETLNDPKTRAEYKVFLDRQAKGLATDVNAVLKAEELVDEAQARVRRKDWTGAIQSIESAIQLNRDDPLYSVILAWSKFNLGKRTPAAARDATELLKQAVKRQENLALAYQYLGEIQFSQESYDDAKRWWRKCLEYDPKNIDASRGLRLANSRDEKKGSGLGGLLNKVFGKK